MGLFKGFCILADLGGKSPSGRLEDLQMPKGQKPKPSAVKKAEGDRSHVGMKRIVDDLKGIGKPVVPSHLGEVERAMWTFIVRSLPDGILSKADTSMIERFVVAWSNYRKCYEAIKLEGMLIRTKQGRIRHPLLVAQNAAAKEMHATSSELGLSPVARARLSTSVLPPDDPMGWLLPGGSEDEEDQGDGKGKRRLDS
jgi:P27 family predicted phage terminase small subunit